MKRLFAGLVAAAFYATPALAQPAASSPAPTPLVAQGQPADWVFIFKQNAGVFPTAANDPGRRCLFGGTPSAQNPIGQQYAFSSSTQPELRQGTGLVGTSTSDPLGATFSQIYSGNYSFVIWNDQFQGLPMRDLIAPWGHSKGMIAWNENGEGIVLQVTTPGWPGAGSARRPRAGDGNTLGCLHRIRNNLIFSQHFFALRLSMSDVEQVLRALENASVVTDVTNPQIAQIGGPASIRALAGRLGARSQSTTVVDAVLSSGVRLISKPSGLHAPPWQLLSARLTRAPAPNGPELRTATWWSAPKIPSTAAGDPRCWGVSSHPGPVAIATSGTWNGQRISLAGGGRGNHAKIGVSVGGPPWYTIFGDLNQQGRLSGTPAQCVSSQNGRGGLFFVVENRELHDGVAALIAGDTAPTTP